MTYDAAAHEAAKARLVSLRDDREMELMSNDYAFSDGSIERIDRRITECEREIGEHAARKNRMVTEPAI